MNFSIEHIETVDSTNKEIIRRYKADAIISPLVVTAKYQTTGKGYENNYWESEKGKNLLFSIGFKPYNILPAQQFILSQIISLAIKDTINSYLPDNNSQIKWPNDIYVKNKKIAGILIQNFIKDQEIDLTVIGVGININQKQFLSLTPNPTSLFLETAKKSNPCSLLTEILKRFEEHYLLALTNPDKLKTTYMASLLRFNEFNHYLLKGKKIRGKIIDVSSHGYLIIETADSKKLSFDFKEIEYIF